MGCLPAAGRSIRSATIRRMRAPALACALALVPSLARAHGAPPVSEQIVLRGAELLVPTHYWGVFFGTETTPWRWICEEAINKDQSRAWALTLDGTYHVTDYAGLTSSRDGGCTWIESTGDIASRSTSAVVADPVDGKRAWATTNEGASAPWNALFTTPDDGLTWTPVLMGDEFFRSPVLSSDGKTIYVAGTSRAAGAPSVTLHVSKDGGATFASVPIAFSLNGAAQSDLEPLAVDPSDPGTVWLAVRAGAMQVLLQATNHGAAPTERFRLQATIGGIGFDPLNHAVLVPVAPLGGATLAGGFMRSVAGAPFAPFSNLHAAQCVLINGATIYACSSEFPPDSMAIGRSDDGGAHFTKVFRYDETV